MKYVIIYVLFLFCAPLFAETIVVDGLYTLGETDKKEIYKYLDDKLKLIEKNANIDMLTIRVSDMQFHGVEFIDSWFNHLLVSKKDIQAMQNEDQLIFALARTFNANQRKKNEAYEKLLNQAAILDSQFRKEISEDLYAVDKMIELGFRPWQSLDYLDLIANSWPQFQNLFPSLTENLPSPNVRKAVLKTYLADRCLNQAISKHCYKSGTSVNTASTIPLEVMEAFGRIKAIPADKNEIPFVVPASSSQQPPKRSKSETLATEIECEPIESPPPPPWAQSWHNDLAKWKEALQKMPQSEFADFEIRILRQIAGEFAKLRNKREETIAYGSDGCSQKFTFELYKLFGAQFKEIYSLLIPRLVHGGLHKELEKFEISAYEISQYISFPLEAIGACAPKTDSAMEMYLTNVKDWMEYRPLFAFAIPSYVLHEHKNDKRFGPNLEHVLRGILESQRNGVPKSEEMSRQLLIPAFWEGFQEAYLNDPPNEDLRKVLIKIVNSANKKTLRDEFAARLLQHDSPREQLSICAFAQKYLAADHAYGAMVITAISEKFSSLADLSQMARKEFSGLGMDSNHLVATLQSLFMNRPDLVAGIKDIQTILETKAFWSLEKPDAKNESELSKYGNKFISKSEKAARGNSVKSTENLHRFILNRMQALRLMPLDIPSKLAFFRKLVEHGASVHSDDLFLEIYDNSDAPQQIALQNEFIESDSIIDPLLLKKMAGDYLFKAKNIDEIRTLDSNERKLFLRNQIRASARVLGFGPSHAALLEEMSWKIESTKEESSQIENGKYPNLEEKDEDFGISMIRSLESTIAKWPHDQQWEMVQFLIGHKNQVRAESQDYFNKNNLSPERVQRVFKSMPLYYQHFVIDSILSHQNGVLKDVQLGTGYTKIILDYLLEMTDRHGKSIAEDVLEAYIYALNELGLHHLRSNVIAHLLVATNPNSEGHSLLKEVFEAFGAMGVKLGQMLVAMDVLPKKESLALRALQDSSRLPDRQTVYEDLIEATTGYESQYKIKRLLGAGSLKYVILAEKIIGDRNIEVALKFIRRNAVHHAAAEEAQLRSMVDYLIKKRGDKYLLFRTAVEAAIKAVKLELSAESEVRNSKLAKEKMYKNCGGKFQFQLAEETFIHERLIESEYAKGVSINHLPMARQDEVARAFLDCERANWYSDPKVVYLEPDRHPGNLLIDENTLTPIDFGQLQTAPREQLKKVTALFALAETFQKNLRAYTSREIQSIFRASGKAESQIASALKSIRVEITDPTVTIYYKILSALERSGIEIDIFFYEVPRALFQFDQYYAYFPRGGRVVEGPKERFGSIVANIAYPWISGETILLVGAIGFVMFLMPRRA